MCNLKVYLHIIKSLMFKCLYANLSPPFQLYFQAGISVVTLKFDIGPTFGEQIAHLKRNVLFKNQFYFHISYVHLLEKVFE